MSNMSFPEEMLLFGCGNMAGAMLTGWLAAGVSPTQFTVIDPITTDIPDGVTHFPDAASAGKKYSCLLLGVKPQMFGEVAGDVQNLLAPGGMLLSIMAGTGHAQLQDTFPDATIVRVMPNLSASLGLSPLGLWGGEINDEGKAFVMAMLEPLGVPEWLDSEDQMDAVTALAGSGPAFVYRFIDALAAGGVATGLSDEMAQRMALQMVLGAAQLAAQSDYTPSELARRVTSPGGTTAAGLDKLDENGALVALLKSTLRAARDRGAELAQKAKGESGT
jgi:pyrroline-5-carboxylate reductase